MTILIKAKNIGEVQQKDYIMKLKGTMTKLNRTQRGNDAKNTIIMPATYPCSFIHCDWINFEIVEGNYIT